jgi:hypothetical protein
MPRFPAASLPGPSLSLSLSLSLLAVVAMSASASAGVKSFKVLTDKSIDTGSLESIVEGVLARSGAKTNDEKAIALYEWLHHTIFHNAYPVEAAPQSVGPLKVINVYGWGLCGGQHTVLKALFETAGWECRYVGWSDPGHTTVEVKYDGKWHYFDVFLKCYYWSRDKSHVVGQEEIAADPGLVLDAVKEGRAARQHLCCGDSAEDVIKGVKSRKVAGDSKGWASVTWRDEGWSPRLNLASGASLRLDWKSEAAAFAVPGKAPQHSCGNKDYRNDPVLGPVVEHYGVRNWSNGAFAYAPDFSKPADLADVSLKGAKAGGGKLVGPGSAEFDLSLPYPFVSAKVEAAFEGDGKLSISVDGGKTWKPVEAGDITAAVKQKYDVRLRAEFSGALTKLRAEGVVEHNRGALPHLVAGRNVITVSAEKGSLPVGASMVVSYSFQEATIADPAKRKRFDGSGITYGPVKTVTKEVTALPFTFEIDVGGNTPPKMISLERAVRAK